MKRLVISIAMSLLACTAVAQDTSSTTVTGTSITTPTPMMNSIRNGPSYIFEPQEDITAYELALALRTIMPAIACRNSWSPRCDVTKQMEALPKSVLRHFTVHPFTVHP